MDLDTINFAKGNGLVPAVVQDADTYVVLMLGYMNKEALSATLKSKRVTFFSRSKDRLWTKGETSGHFLNLVDIKIDCDQDTLLIKAHPAGPACHTGADTCFNENNHRNFDLNNLARIIKERKAVSPDESYTAKLFEKGINKIAQKVGEEAVELVIEAKDDNNDLFIDEAADLLYHLLVLLEYKQVPLFTIEQELAKRHSKNPK